MSKKLTKEQQLLKILYKANTKETFFMVALQFAALLHGEGDDLMGGLPIFEHEIERQR